MARDGAGTDVARVVVQILVSRAAGREWPVVSIRSWMRNRGASAGGLQSDRAPVLEELEPRLLLNADLSGSTSLLSLPTASDGSVLMVDLDQPQEGTPEAGTPLVSLEAADSGAVADESSQVGESLGAPLDPDPVKSPVTHTQMYAGVDVQPSTATVSAAADFPVLGLPASYDLRTSGDVTPVKDQGDAGSCWAFGTYGSLESSILVAGGPVTDFSENHLKNYHGFDWGPTAGGNYYMSEAYLSRWDGPVSEADDPYHDTDDRPSPGGPPQYYVREVLELDSDAEIKNVLMTYGAVGTVMYWNTSYYNASTHTYYYNGTAYANHAVTIVGWNDTKAVSGTSVVGAWLIKNSWGAAWGDAGYFWLSYADTRGGNDGFCFYDAVPPTTYEKVYYHDYFGSVGSWDISYAFNAFTATSAQDLVAVQFWTMADGASYEIGVWDTFAGGQLSAPLGTVSGTSAYAGKHTVNFTAPIHLTAGNDFYISLHITSGGDYPMSADWRVSGYSSTCTAGAGESYYSSNGSTWTDLMTLDSTSNFSIRGLVTTTMPPEITVLGNGISISDGDITPASADGTDFGSTSVGGAGVSRTFTVYNDGTGTLMLGAVTVPTGFTLTEGLSSSLAPSASDTFTVRLDAEEGGTRSSYIFIQNDDRDEHPFNFAITGTVLVQDITVLGNGLSIMDGDLSPDTSDGTDFGAIPVGGAPISHTFTVRNDGTGTLTLGTVTVPAGFTLTKGLVASLGPGASDTFTVRLDVGPRGTRMGEVSIPNNDPTENPFNFRIQGTVLGLPQPGDLDVTFGGGGVVFTDFGTDSGHPQAVAIASNGKIVVAGYCTSGHLDFALARYNVNGSLDTSFDGDGKVLTAIGSEVDIGAGVAVQSDGKILAVGYSYTGSNNDFAVVRYNVNGSLDTSFGGDGTVTTAIGSSNDMAARVVLQPDGKIVVAGRTNIGGTHYFPNYAFAVVRYDTDGSLDTSFDGDGKVLTAFGESSEGNDVALQSDGKIVVVGKHYDGTASDFAVVRYNTDGSLDASFGPGGMVTTDLGSNADWAYGVVLQPDGEIVVSGVSDLGNFALVRYNANGSLDTSFDGDGKVTTDLGSSDFGYNVALQSDGKILVGGNSHPGSAVVRYNVDGSLDTSFGTGGIAHSDYPTGAYGMALQSDGKIVVTGESGRGWAVARFLGDGLSSGEITVLGNGISIADGDTTPSSADGTDFGAEPVGAAAVSRTFTVRNDGSTVLTLGAVTVPTGFTLTEGLSPSLAPEASDTFTVRLDTDVVGLKGGEVSFATNDLDENPFNFRIAGAVGNLALNRPAAASTSYPGLPAANATDGDPGTRWSSAFSDHEWIYVDLGSLYTIAQVVLRWEPAYGRGYKIQLSDDASAWSDVYSTTTGDGGIDDITLTPPASGRYVRMLGTQRATAYGYSLWEFEIYGYTPPEIEVLGNGVSIADGDATPGTADDTDFGAVLQGGPALSRTFTVRNDGGSALTLGAVTVPAGFTLTEGLSASLAAGASDTFTVQLDTATAGTMAGEISFATNDSDEDPFNFGIGGTVLPAPMITVWGNGVVIADGDTTPSAADGTDFGSVVYGDPALGRTFTVRNDGGAALTLGEVTVPAGYTLTEPLASSLAPGASDTFTVQLETTAPGIKAGEIAFSNNDAEENPFHFAITGTVLAPAEITVLGNGIVIAAGDATPDTADNTDFGSVLQGAAAVSRIFVVRNDGGATLTLGAVIVPAGFTLTEGLSTSLAAGASDTFTVRLDAAAAGIKTGDISFATNDADENPFQFRIAGTVVPASEITVLGNGISITNGDTTPSAGDGTDFGFAAQGAAGVSRTFTVRNDGSAVLVLGPVTVPAGYTLTEGLSASLAPGEFDTFTVQLDTALTGTLMGDVSFSTNDPDENPFGFRISGTVVDDGNLALGRPVTASTSYGGLSASNVTDGNPASRWSSQFSDNEWIYVDLGSVFTIKRVVLRWEAAYGRGYKIQISGDASSWSDVYSTVAGDGGVDEITLSAPAAGRYVRMLGTQRATVYGYSLWEFEVYAGGGGAPQVTVTVAPSGVAEDGPANLVYTFTRSVADGSPLTVSFTVGGTATFGVDYTPSGAASFDAASGTVTIPASQTTATVTVDPTADTTTEPDETVILTVTAGAGYTVGTPAASTGTIQNDDASGNLALGRPATASTSYTGLPASNATDGNPGSRWSSQFSDNEWLYVDLGATYTINRVVLRWEGAYGRGYKIQVSSDASTWSDVYSTATGDGGVDDITLAAPASGRYVRMLGTQRATMYGYSLFEIEVYGGGAVNHAPVVSDVSKSLMQDAPLSFAAADFAAAFTDPDAGDSLQKIKIASLPTHGALTLNGAAVAVDQEIPAAELGTLVYTPNSGYTGSDSFQWNGSDGGLYAAATAAVNLSISAAAANLALHKTAVASTSYSGLPASNATDGNVNSRWSSQFSDNEWLYVDLGAVFPINRVVLRWEAAYGRGYKLQVSSDASTWSDVYVTTTGDGSVDDITLAAPASGRYVRLLGLQRATVYGYSLYELEVYAQAAAPNLALSKPTTASTSYSGLPASNATDGDTASRWSSQFSDNEWLYVDLGAVFTIHQVILRWETAYGRGYTIQVSNDASVWSDVYSTTTGDGGVDEITLVAPVSGRYVRLLGTQRATVYGYSLWEFEVYA